jgi:hypothetical protein
MLFDPTFVLRLATSRGSSSRKARRASARFQSPLVRTYSGSCRRLFWAAEIFPYRGRYFLTFDCPTIAAVPLSDNDFHLQSVGLAVADLTSASPLLARQRVRLPRVQAAGVEPAIGALPRIRRDGSRTGHIDDLAGNGRKCTVEVLSGLGNQ